MKIKSKFEVMKWRTAVNRVLSSHTPWWRAKNIGYPKQQLSKDYKPLQELQLSHFEGTTFPMGGLGLYNWNKH